MYTKAFREWTTTLCTHDTESCVVSTLLPCHVYAKLNLSSYGIHFLSYAFFILCIRNIYSTLGYLHEYQCPSLETTQCILLTPEKCPHHFMSLNGVDTPCIYYSDSDLCLYSSTECIQVHPTAYTWLGIFLSLSYLCLFYMNYSARKIIRNTYSIEPHHECMASSGCSICGLAQAYREIV